MNRRVRLCRHLSRCWLTAVLCLSGMASVKAQEFGIDSLRELVQAVAPIGWTLTVRGDELVVQRPRPVEIYNGLAMAGRRPEEEIKRRLQQENLVVVLRLARPMNQQQYDTIAAANEAALQAARKDAGPLKLVPDAAFWREHPEYGFRELPAFNLGDHSVFLRSEPADVVYVGRKRGGGHLWEFRDQAVEQECQGFIDNLAKLFPTYRKGPP